MLRILVPSGHKPLSAPLSKHKECKPEVILENEIEVPSIILIARNSTMTMEKQILKKKRIYNIPYSILYLIE